MVKSLGNPNKRLRVPRSRTRSKKAKLDRILALKEITTKAKAVPCKDCGKSYNYYVMDFDHLEPTHKEYTISKMVQDGKCTDQELLDEIAKCEVVCANCHRERTHIQAKERYKNQTWRKKRSKFLTTGMSNISDTWAKMKT
jgi:hypothetical protein